MGKVCHITTVHQRYDIRIFQKECKSLAKEGWDVTLIVHDSMPDQVVEGVKIISTKRERKNRIERMTKIPKVVFKIAIDVEADIYHIHDPELLPMAAKLHKCGKKVVFDSHEFTAKQILTKHYLPKISRKILSKLYRSYESIVIRQIDGVISPCMYNGEDYFEKDNENRAFINNYPFISILDKNKKCEPNKKEQICYLGGITKERGAVAMVKAVGIAKYPLILAGGFSPSEMKYELEKEYGYQYVEYKGVVSHKEAVEIVKESGIGFSVLQNVGQYPYLHNLPTKVYEYMAAGIPVIISDFEYVRNVLEKYKFGIAVNPGDVEEIAEAIQKISKDKELVYFMGEEGKRAVKEQFNWENDMKILLDFYEKVIEK